MFSKLSPFRIPLLIPNCFFSIKLLSTLPRSTHVQLDPATDKNPPGLDPNFQNRICPDTLIRVLDDAHDLNSAVKLFDWASLQSNRRHTSTAYFEVILKLGLAGNVEEMEGFYREMVKAKCPNGQEALLSLMGLFMDNGRLREAIRVMLVLASTGYQIPIERFNRLLSAVVDTRMDFSHVLLVYKEMVKLGIVPNVDTLNHLIKALFDAGRMENALDQFRRMAKKRCVPNSMTFEILVCDLLGVDRVDESIERVNEMLELGCNPDASFYSNVVPLLCRANRHGEAIRLLEMMRASKVPLSSPVYTALIRCLSINHQIDKAIKLVDEMKEAGFSPSSDLLVDLIDACCEVADFDKAKNFLKENDALESSPYNVLVEGYCEEGDFLSATALFHEMLNLGVADAVSYNVFIRKLCEFSSVRQAYEVLGKMVIKDHAPDSVTYSSLIIGNCRLGKYEEALRLCYLVFTENWVLDPLSYAELIEGLRSAGKIQKANEVFYTMSSKNCVLQSSSLGVLIKSTCSAGMLDDALELLTYAHYRGNPIDTASYTAIMHGLSQSSRSKETLILLAQMLKLYLALDVDAYCILVQCMIKLDHVREFLLLVNRMVAKDSVPDSKTLIDVLEYSAKHCKLHMMLVAIDRLEYEGGVVNSVMYNILIGGLWREGYKRKANELLDSMLGKGWVPDANVHGLFTGSHCRKVDLRKMQNANCIDQDDEISSILSEGLGGV